MYSRPKRSRWRHFSLTVCLFAASLLAPMIWREVRSYRASSNDATAAKIASDADRCLGLASQAAESEPSLVGPARLDPPCERPFDGLTSGPDEVPPPLAALKDAVAGRVGQWRVAIEPSGAVIANEDEELSDTPAPSVFDDILLASDAEPLSLETTRWAMPTQLLKALNELSGTAPYGNWAEETTKLAESLPAAATPQEVGNGLQALRKQLTAVDALLSREKDTALASQARRVRHGLERRLDVWQGVHELQRPSATFVSRDYNLKRLAAALDKAQSFIQEASDSSGWSTYLMLAELGELARDPHATPEQGEQVLRRAVARHRARGLWARQRRYLRSPPLAELKTELLRLLDEPVDSTRLLELLEVYEADGRPDTAEEIGESLGRLSRSVRPTERQLAGQIEQHYRGANLRLSLSQAFLAHVLPQQNAPQLRRVNETIMGVPVSGQALSRNELRARMLPSGQDVLRVELLAHGSVESDTIGRTGSVTTFTQTESRYVLSKLVEFHNDRVQPYPARVQWVRANTQLNELRTSWDSVPIFGEIARSIAASRFQETALQRQSEVEQKVADRALREFEAQAGRGISRLNMEYVKHVIVPLYRLELEPELVAESPHEDRVTMRFRLANEHQLGSHTPRPRALAESLGSLQVHESLVNNVIEQLSLGGRTLNGAELIKYLNAKFNVRLRVEKQPADKSQESDEAAPDEAAPDEAFEENAERVQFTFVQRDPVRVRLADGRIVLIVSLEQLEAGGRRWRNFQLLVPYELRPVGRTVELVQVGETSVVGRIGSRSQIILRGIMTNIFDKDRTYRILDELMSNPRLAGMRVVHVEITDGWLGLSLDTEGAVIGKKQSAVASRRQVAARPSSLPLVGPMQGALENQ